MNPITVFLPLLLVGLVFGPRLIRAWDDFQARKAYAKDIANVRLILGPRLVCSEWEGDCTVFERGEELRGLVAISNHQWITPEDIVIRVYDPYKDGKTAMPFDAWRTAVQQEFGVISARRKAEIHGMGQFDPTLFAQNLNGKI